MHFRPCRNECDCLLYYVVIRQQLLKENKAFSLILGCILLFQIVVLLKRLKNLENEKELSSGKIPLQDMNGTFTISEENETEKVHELQKKVEELEQKLEEKRSKPKKKVNFLFVYWVYQTSMGQTATFW